MPGKTHAFAGIFIDGANEAGAAATAGAPDEAGLLWRAEGDTPLGSEDEALALVDSFFPVRSPHVPFGRGHDCAELARLPGSIALSTDMFLQDAHFRLAYVTPQEAGGKALASAVSDLAAAGARPLGFSLGLTLPGWIGRNALSGVLAGMAARAQEYGMVLSGGDLARGKSLGFCLTVWGAPARARTPFLRRDTPRPGDVLFLVGEGGMARVGLWALESSGRAAQEAFPHGCRAFLAPRPRLDEGQALALLAAETDGRISLMDLSDGLARDLPRLLGGVKSGLGADLDWSAESLHPELHAAAARMGAQADAVFFAGGEEYALLGSCDATLFARVRERTDARRLGVVTAREGLVRNGKALAVRGFDHFSGDAATPGAQKLAPGRPDMPEGGIKDADCAEAAADIVHTGREAWQAGLMAGFNGNISRKLERGGEDHCLVTCSGSAKARLTPASLCLLRLPDGALLQGPPASTESAVHTGIYAACPQSRAVLHTHPPCLLALSLLLEPAQRLVLPLPEAQAYLAKISWTPFFPPGTVELAEAVALAATKTPAVWMERHGLVVHGPDLAFALSLTEELEQLARIQLAGGKG